MDKKYDMYVVEVRDTDKLHHVYQDIPSQSRHQYGLNKGDVITLQEYDDDGTCEYFQYTCIDEDDVERLLVVENSGWLYEHIRCNWEYHKDCYGDDALTFKQYCRFIEHCIIKEEV